MVSRKIFWSDWNRASPKLEWANEDGTDRAIFLQGDYVKLPNSLSIDWAMDELCWSDAGTFTISKDRSPHEIFSANRRDTIIVS